MDTEHPEKIGQYDVLSLIGKGGMGKVYKGVEPSSNQVVAIKVLPSEFRDDPERVERFNREAEAIALLSHPNVVRIIEKGQEGDNLYFAMEFVPGTTLATILKQRRLSLPEAIRVFKSVCLGLAAAHQNTIVHRDLSPRNILVSEDLSTVKIVDFGISRIETFSRAHGTLSTSEFSLGSLHYMAPEQARDMKNADHRADIYSLGVLLYEMLTGRVPVGRFNLPSQINSEVPPEMDPIVLRCLEAQAQSRYPSVSRLLTDISRLEDQLRLGLVHEVRGIGSSTSKILLKSTGNRSLRIGLIAAGAIVLIGAALFLGRTHQSRNQAPAEPAGAKLESVEPAGAVEVGALERPEVEEPQVDPLAEAIAELKVPEVEPAPEPSSGTVQQIPTSEAAVPVTTSAPAPASIPPTPAARPTAKLAEDLKVARNKLEAGLLKEAEQDLETLISENPKASVTPSAYLLLGAVHERQNQVEKARAAYVELRSRFPNTEEAAECMYRSAKLLQAEGGRDQLRAARDLLAELAEQRPGSKWAAQSLVDKAAIEKEDKLAVQDPLLATQVPAALVTFRELVSRYPNHPGVEDALWNLGEMYSELKDFERAARAFEDLGERFPGTRYDAWWEAGQVYDRRLDQDEKAVAAYEKVPRSSRRYDEAQRKINKLSKR